MNDSHLIKFYVVAAALAGSITSLAFMQWKQMSWGEILFTVFVGFGFAIFFVPWIAADIAGLDIERVRVLCGAVYAGGTGANMLIPLLLKRGKKYVEGDGA